MSMRNTCLHCCVLSFVNFSSSVCRHLKILSKHLVSHIISSFSCLFTHRNFIPAAFNLITPVPVSVEVSSSYVKIGFMLYNSCFLIFPVSKWYL
jgi:hypothetical protein